MKILITGSKGYIGTALYNALQRKHEVVGLGKKDLDLTNLNQVKEFLKNKYFDVVIHCAITGGNRLDIDNSNILDNNLKMFYNLVECESNFGKLIHFGSGAEKQNTFYGLSKKVINESIKNKDKFYNIRILAVFDENELVTKFVKTNIFNYINKKDIEIFQNKYMDFFYMNDFISLIEYYVENNFLSKEINCCYNHYVTLYDVAQIINNLDNHKVNINIKHWDMAPPFNEEFTDLGLQFIGLEQGIKNVYEKLKNEY
jgi:GDP-L-fucose synthase